MTRNIVGPVAIVVAALAGCVSDGGEERRTLTIVTDATFPPFHFIDESGQPTGFDIELASQMVERAGYRPVVVVKPYDELHAGLNESAHDLVAATTGVTPEREETYLFTRPYFETSQVALVRAGDGEPSALSELAGRNVGASGAGTAARAMRSIVDAKHVELSEEGTAPLEDGTVDAIVVDEFDAVATARASGGSLRVLSEPIASERYAFVVALGRGELKRELDGSLAALESDGELAALRSRFGVERDVEWPVPLAPPSMAVTQGVAETQRSCVAAGACGGGGNIREAFCGEKTAGDGTVWAVPGPVTDGAIAVDVFNECTVGGANEDYASELETAVLDEDGEDITAHVFADNYFELYVNGRFMGKDAVEFTPFNAHAARYRVRYPVTYAVLLVDWEGYLGIGLEDTGGAFHIGDGGFIATFSDGVTTDDTWKCGVFYVAPLDEPSCVAVDESGNLDSAACPSKDDTVSCVTNDPERSCQALHRAVPDDWTSPEFDDSGWLAASTYTADEVTGAPGFRDYEDTLFAGGEFIWTSNLDLDNLVLCRKTVTVKP